MSEWKKYKLKDFADINPTERLPRITPSLENGKTSYVDILDEGEIGFGSTEFIVLREKKIFQTSILFII